jgi:Xaa-Pro aminopeptidase
MSDPMVSQKLEQVPAILDEMGIDLWLLYARESHTVHDPCFDLVVGTNITWESAFLLTRKGDRIALVGSLDAANIRAHGHYPEVVGYGNGVRDDLRKIISRIDPRRIAINYSLDDPMADGLTHGMFLSLTRALEGTPYAARLESSEAIVAALRGRKSPAERARIAAACEVTVQIYERLTPRLRAGLTEKQVAAMILEETARFPGLELAWEPEQCPAVFTGPESAGAHAGPTDRRIEPGHLLNTDFGVRKDGYCSDLQRTWYILRPGEDRAPEAVQRGFDTIVEAIERAADALRPGVRSGDVDSIARGHITAKGYPEYPHALGHQVGRVAHDGAGLLCPAWERYGKLHEKPVEQGQVYTLEPRLPVPGHGVATVEEIVAVDADGCTFLSKPQKKLWIVGEAADA